jgi:hypothetical protein
MTGFDDDRELDEFLGRRSALHRRLADRDHSEPPPELDRIVLTRAREAIEVPAGGPIHRAPRWALPVSLAATVVLALAVVLNFARMESGESPVAASTRPTDAALEMRPEPPARSDAPVTQDMRLADTGATRIAANSAAAPTEDLALQEVRAPATALAKAQPSGAVQMPPAVHAASDAGAAPAEPPASARAAESGGARVLHAQASQARAIVPAKREMAFSTEETESVLVTAPPRPQTESTAANAIAAITVSGATLESVSPDLPSPHAAEKDGPAQLSEAAKRADPQAWRREIERLRAAGKNAEADRELAEFRKAFPGEALPAATRDRRPAR